MIKLALLGRDIQHSKSKKMYEKIYDSEIDYQLIDCSLESDIPSLNEIFSTVSGLSITAPYKKVFLDQLIMSDDIEKLNAVNCIKKEGNSFFGTNTDYLAMIESLDELNFLDKQIVLLGSGSMSKITETYLNTVGKDFIHIYRSMYGEMENIDFEQFGENILVINSCARNFSFQGNINKKTTFWDYNYSHSNHINYLSNKCEYVDGLGLLFKQAMHATRFWNFNSF